MITKDLITDAITQVHELTGPVNSWESAFRVTRVDWNTLIELSASLEAHSAQQIVEFMTGEVAEPPSFSHAFFHGMLLGVIAARREVTESLMETQDDTE